MSGGLSNCGEYGLERNTAGAICDGLSGRGDCECEVRDCKRSSLMVIGEEDALLELIGTISRSG